MRPARAARAPSVSCSGAARGLEAHEERAAEAEQIREDIRRIAERGPQHRDAARVVRAPRIGVLQDLVRLIQRLEARRSRRIRILVSVQLFRLREVRPLKFGRARVGAHPERRRARSLPPWPPLAESGRPTAGCETGSTQNLRRKTGAL
jgi:hypothetical protein